MGKADVFVSVVAVCRDQAGLLPEFVREVSAVLDAHYANYEILLLDNSSTDATAATVRGLLGSARCVRYLQLSRQTDEETALTAGLDAAIGDYVVTVHPDLDPPAEIPTLVERSRAGADVVVGVERNPPPRGRAYQFLRRVYMRLTKTLVRLEPVHGVTSFRCLSRAAVSALTRIRSRRRYFAVVLAEIGFRPVVFPYDRHPRSGVRAFPSLPRSVRTGLSVLVHYSVAPLRWVSVLGLVGSLLSLLYSGYVIVVYLVKRDVLQGWTTLSLQVSGLFFLVFVMLALIGEYLGRLLDELVDRPLYHVREEQSSAVMLSDLARRNVLDRSTDPAPGAPPP
jgi:glycosyltransferase involved in cell wall biosynthesis